MDLCTCESEESSHGKGAGVWYSVVRCITVNRSPRSRHMGEGSVSKITYVPCIHWVVWRTGTPKDRDRLMMILFYDIRIKKGDSQGKNVTLEL